jgi:hypothetical protein
MTKHTTNVNSNWYHQRKWAAVIAVASLLACYGVASLAIDTGSLLQYALAIGLLVLAINRLAHIVIVSLHRRTA